MGINLGLDIGAISLKLAALGGAADLPLLRALAALRPEFRLSLVAERPVLLSDYRRLSGSPVQSAYDLLQEVYAAIPAERVEGMRVTGSGSRAIAKVLGLFFENEFKAIARAIAALYPRVRTVFEIGGESSKYIRLSDAGIVDYDRSGECAAGTGSFLDQQALRMQYSVEEVGALVRTAGCAARIAGRCSVFAKSDMIHAQQKGYSPAEILRGLCDAVARNYKSAVVKGRPVEAPVALIGAVSQNAGVTAALREAFGLAESDLLVPAEYAWCGAIGAAILEAEDPRKRSILEIHRLRQHDSLPIPEDSRPLSLENVVRLQPRPSRHASVISGRIPAYLGLDIGSVSTNLVLLDDAGAVVHDVYLRTAGRPIEVVQQGLAELERLWGRRVEIQGVGTTGSGRELIAEFVGRRRGQRRDHRPQNRSRSHQPHAGRRARRHHLRDRRAGLQVHLHRKRRGGGLRHERSLRRGHRLVPGRAGRKAGHLHQGRVCRAGASGAQPHAPGRTLHGLHGARRQRLAAQGRNRFPTWWPAWPTPSR